MGRLKLKCVKDSSYLEYVDIEHWFFLIFFLILVPMCGNLSLLSIVDLYHFCGSYFSSNV